MSETVARGSAALTLRARRPAYSVMQECLRVQAAAPELTRRQRLLGHSPLSADARSWYAGALGEIEVARVLSELGPDWTVLHSVPVGSGESDIDHVVIGPTGVFTINTKNHAGKKVWVGGGTFMVNGHRTSHARNSGFEAKRASRLVSSAAGVDVAVVPVIVLVGTASLKFGDKAPAVPVVTAPQLRGWLLSLPKVHSAEALAYLTMVAEERSTWHTEALVLTDTLRHEHRFERLRREIDDAARRRRRWQVGTGLAILGASGGVVIAAVAAFTNTVAATIS
jgi:hypothetical protein